MGKRWLTIVSLLLTVFIAGGTAMAGEAQDAMDQIMKRGKLIVATELGTPPWAFKDPKTGEITGFTIELARMLADDLGVELEIKPYEWAGIIPSLLTSKVDMLTACLTRTVPRSAKLMYAEPYVNMPGQVLVRKGEFNSLESLNNKKVVLTCTTGSVWEQIAEKRLSGATIRTNPTNADNAIALQTKRADGYLNDKLQLVSAMAMYPGQFELVPAPLAWDSFAFAVRYDSFKLWNTTNLFMRLIKMDGRYGKLFKKYMGYEWVATPESAS
jgi:ABC-type amino acid transport substrate-binding protein